MKLIFATGPNYEFSNNGGLPWGKTIKEDMTSYVEFTKNCTKLMGYKTWISLPEKTKEKYKDSTITLFSREDNNYYSFQSTNKAFVLPSNLSKSENTENNGGSTLYYELKSQQQTKTPADFKDTIMYLKDHELAGALSGNESVDYCLIGGKSYIEAAIDNVELFDEIIHTIIEPHEAKGYPFDSKISEGSIGKLNSSKLKHTKITLVNDELGYTVHINHYKNI